MKLCRYCKQTKEMEEFKLTFNGSSFYRQKTCIACTEVLSPNYRVRRRNELAALKNPFTKVYRENNTHPNLLPGDPL